MHAAGVERVKPRQNFVAERHASIANVHKIERRAAGDSRIRVRENLRPVHGRILRSIARVVGQRDSRQRVCNLDDLRTRVTAPPRPRRERREAVRLRNRRRRLQLRDRCITHLLAIRIRQRGHVDRLVDDVPLVVIQRDVAQARAQHQLGDRLGALGVGRVVHDNLADTNGLQHV